MFEEWSKAKTTGRHSYSVNEQTIAEYLSERAETVKPSTVARAWRGIQHHLRIHRFGDVADSEYVARVVRGIQRVHDSRTKKAPPLLKPELHVLVDCCEHKRDEALLLVGWWAALRASELVALRWADLEWTTQGVLASLRKRKTKQVGGEVVALPYLADVDYCPVVALVKWCRRLVPQPGEAVFPRLAGGEPIKRDCGISRRAVSYLIERLTSQAGLDQHYSSHSLRAGFATWAARCGVDSLSIARQTGHQKLETLAGYIRHGNAFVDHPALRM